MSCTKQQNIVRACHGGKMKSQWHCEMKFFGASVHERRNDEKVYQTTLLVLAFPVWRLPLPARGRCADQHQNRVEVQRVRDEIGGKYLTVRPASAGRNISKIKLDK